MKKGLTDFLKRIRIIKPENTQRNGINECNKRFLLGNGISIEELSSCVDCTIHSRREENPIVAGYKFETESKMENVSIADIIGYEYQNKGGNNIFLSMNYFFYTSNEGTGYTSRSIGMLDYREDNILGGLKESFINEPISLIETGEGHYNVFYNGFHRYTLLRILYLNEVAKAKGDKEQLEQLRKKYTIPAMVTGVDLDKTYCKYLLTKTRCGEEEGDIADVLDVYNYDNIKTGKVAVKYKGGKVDILTNEQLRNLTRARIAEEQGFIINNPEIQEAYNKYQSFREFVDAKLSGIITLEKQNTEEKGLD